MGVNNTMENKNTKEVKKSKGLNVGLVSGFMAGGIFIALVGAIIKLTGLFLTSKLADSLGELLQLLWFGFLLAAVMMIILMINRITNKKVRE
jgi:hypothetical protein